MFSLHMFFSMASRTTVQRFDSECQKSVLYMLEVSVVEAE